MCSYSSHVLPVFFFTAVWVSDGTSIHNVGQASTKVPKTTRTFLRSMWTTMLAASKKIENFLQLEKGEDKKIAAKNVSSTA